MVDFTVQPFQKTFTKFCTIVTFTKFCTIISVIRKNKSISLITKWNAFRIEQISNKPLISREAQTHVHSCYNNAST